MEAQIELLVQPHLDVGPKIASAGNRSPDSNRFDKIEIAGLHVDILEASVRDSHRRGRRAWTLAEFYVCGTNPQDYASRQSQRGATVISPKILNGTLCHGAVHLSKGGRPAVWECQIPTIYISLLVAFKISDKAIDEIEESRRCLEVIDQKAYPCFERNQHSLEHSENSFLVKSELAPLQWGHDAEVVRCSPRLTAARESSWRNDKAEVQSAIRISIHRIHNSAPLLNMGRFRPAR